MNIRIGHGYDVHKFCEGDHIMLCGVKVSHDSAFEAHSDGDVALHAITDAILGAAALGDIGRHFPDTDPAWKNADSKKLLQAIWIPLREQGYTLGNIDVTIVAQTPRLAHYIEKMTESVAMTLGISVRQVNVKATTTEGLGFVGQRKGIETHAVVIIGTPE